MFSLADELVDEAVPGPVGGMKNPVEFLNPGSPEAKKQGCRCPVLDNHPMGRGGMAIPELGVFVTTAECKMHWEDKEGERES